MGILEDEEQMKALKEWGKKQEEKEKMKLIKRKKNERVKIKIKYHADIDHVEKIAVGDWIDLRSASTYFIGKGAFEYIDLGVSMQLPDGYEAHVAPRSSTPKKFGIVCANSFGVIDNSYCGDDDVWKFPAIAIRDAVINKNDRICQFRIVKQQPMIEFEEVEKLGNKNRGGVGSTGKR